ncbi:Possible glyoxalase/bleomycin resistance protein/ dioxygenase [Mycobacteroides abscessus subsp. abscessus]|nr:Possible glyoxalase/bleomycin resistance protein/ dioxygenase [Mycobacteroides abscessus subsp. abscessus]
MRSVSKSLVKRELWILLLPLKRFFAYQLKSREQVDELVNKALSEGGTTNSESQEHGFMYGWDFQDLDGHIWEVVYMDESAF